MVTKVFVYGTLKKWNKLNYIISRGKYLGKHITPPKYNMVDYGNGMFPIVYPKNKGHKICGDLYEVDKDTYEYVYLMERGAGYAEKEVQLTPLNKQNKTCINAVMFIYSNKPDQGWISDVFIDVQDNVKTWKGFK